MNLQSGTKADLYGKVMPMSFAQNPVLQIMRTPNPQTLKFVVSQVLIEQGVANFTRRDEAKANPLVTSLFDIPGVTAVMVGKDFISVSKQPSADWNEVSENTQWESLQEKVSQVIQKQLPHHEAKIQSTSTASTSNTGNDDEIASKIKTILDQEIRPAVAMDGGDITFERFENGTVYLHLKGACSGCPSSAMTLQMGIENRLKETIPEVKNVVSL